MEELVKRALERHKKGYSCSQSVLCAFSELLGIDEKLLFKVSEGFGFGMGTMDTCGAVTGMFMVAGLVNSSGSVENGLTKPDTMKLVKELGMRFHEKNQSVVCRELKGVDTGKVLRSCDGCIEDAVRIAAEKLFPEKYGKEGEEKQK